MHDSVTYLNQTPTFEHSLPSINVNPREWIKSKLTFIEVLTINNYKITFWEQYTNLNIYKYKQL